MSGANLVAPTANPTAINNPSGTDTLDVNLLNSMMQGAGGLQPSNNAFNLSGYGNPSGLGLNDPQTAQLLGMLYQLIQTDPNLLLQLLQGFGTAGPAPMGTDLAYPTPGIPGFQPTGDGTFGAGPGVDSGFGIAGNTIPYQSGNTGGGGFGSSPSPSISDSGYGSGAPSVGRGGEIYGGSNGGGEIYSGGNEGSGPRIQTQDENTAIFTSPDSNTGKSEKSKRDPGGGQIEPEGPPGEGKPSKKPGTVEPDDSGSTKGKNRIDKVVNWATSQEGYREGANNRNKFGGSGKGFKTNNQPWCAHFVSKAFERNGGSPFGHQASVASIKQWGVNHGRFIKGGNTPKKGDVVIFGASGSRHTGIVTSVKNGRVNTIEGNSSNQVRKRSYSVKDGDINGYVRAVGEKPSKASESKSKPKKA